MSAPRRSYSARFAATRDRHGFRGLVAAGWGRFWMLFAGVPGLRRATNAVAGWFVPPFYGRMRLARYARAGYVAPGARVTYAHLKRGDNTYIGDRVVILRDAHGGPVELGDRAHINDESWLVTGTGGAIAVGADTHIQGRCHLTAYEASIRIGSKVHIGPACGFYPYDHGFSEPGDVGSQPVTSRGDIVVEDEAWLGHGVIVLSGVTIGSGAVVAAGSVVNADVAPGAVVGGVPARVLGQRGV